MKYDRFEHHHNIFRYNRLVDFDLIPSMTKARQQLAQNYILFVCLTIT